MLVQISLMVNLDFEASSATESNGATILGLSQFSLTICDSQSIVSHSCKRTHNLVARSQPTRLLQTRLANRCIRVGLTLLQEYSFSLECVLY